MRVSSNEARNGWRQCNVLQRRGFAGMRPKHRLPRLFAPPPAAACGAREVYSRGNRGVLEGYSRATAFLKGLDSRANRANIGI